MQFWLELARGPLFRFTFAVMVLGLTRNVVLLAWGLIDAYRRTDHKQLSWRRVAQQTMGWLVPVTHLGQRSWYTVTSIVFHVGVILVPIFLFAHVRMVQTNIGVGWPTLPMGVADVLTILTVAAIFALLLGRIGSQGARGLSRGQDYLVPILVAIPFVFGFLASHQHLNPFSYDFSMLVHMLSAELCFLLVPFSKLSHMILMPFAQLPSELAWRFPPDYPKAVAEQIGTEGRPI
jgi:nitrate reductase gamma subunit